MYHNILFRASLPLLALVCALGAAADDLRREPGYRGIWFPLGQVTEHGDKYSGGLGTYTAKHRPLAVHAPEAEKTFFTYGGSRDGERYLLIMAGYYDHRTGTVPRPVVVHDKDGVNDPHDNGVIALDGDGHVWIFVSGRGRSRPGFVYRSLEPHSIDGFEQVRECEMTYPQPFWTEDGGFFHFFTKYTQGRELYWNTSTYGRDWTEDRKLAGMGGHYQVTGMQGNRLGTAFNRHPGGNVDRRTDLYYIETRDGGETWQTLDGTTLETPMESVDSPALVHDYAADERLVYVKDLDFDDAGRPVVLYVTSSHHTPGPKGDPRIWEIAVGEADGWRIETITQSTHNYDMGQVWIEGDLWRVLAPTDAGPQPLGTGGEVVLWESRDAGKSWERIRNITEGSTLNQGYVRRPVDVHPDFYAFWADGNPDRHSASHLYFTDHSGEGLWRLPYTMGEDHEAPHRLR